MNRTASSKKNSTARRRYTDEQVRAMLEDKFLWREQLRVAARERGLGEHLTSVSDSYVVFKVFTQLEESMKGGSR